MIDSLTQMLSRAYERATLIASEYLPHFIATVAIMLLGWGVALASKKATLLLVSRLQKYLERFEWIHIRARQLAAYNASPKVFSLIVFWTILLLFASTAVEALGLPAISGLLSKLTSYLPRLLASLLIMLIGILIGDVTKDAIVRASNQLGKSYGTVVSRLAQATIITVAFIIAIEQLGINGTILTLTVTILFGTTLGAIALSFSLGASQTVSNMLAIRQISLSYEIGDSIKIGSVEGCIIGFTQTAIILSSDDGEIMVPGKHFASKVSISKTRHNQDAT